MVGKGILVLLVAALVAVGWTRHEDRVHQQVRLAAIASDLVGHRVGVHCPNAVSKLVDVSREAGRVQFDENGRPAGYTDLAPETCDRLRHPDRVDFSCLDTGTCGYREFQVGWAIHTLAHESFHLRGISQEAATECYAMQTTAVVAVRLGIPPSRAAQLQSWIFAKAYPNEPDEYRTSECHDGGPYDLNPDSPVWP